MNWKFLGASVLCCSATSMCMVTGPGSAQSKSKSAEQSAVLIEEDEELEFVYSLPDPTIRLLCGDENSYIKIGDSDDDGNPIMVKYFARPSEAFQIKDSSGEYILAWCGAGEGDGEDGYGVSVASIVKRTPDGWRQVYRTKNYHYSYTSGRCTPGGESLQHVEAADIDGDSTVEIIHSVYREKESNYRIYIKRKDGSRTIGEVDIEKNFCEGSEEGIKKSCAYKLKEINLYLVDKSGKTIFSQKASHSKSKKAIGKKTYDYIVGHFTNDQDCVFR